MLEHCPDHTRLSAFVVFPAETREAQVCAVCDFCGKRQHHHWRLKWEHSGVGKRHVNEFMTFKRGEESKATFTNAPNLKPALSTFF